MRTLRTMWIYVAGALVFVLVLTFVEWPDSLFACLSVVLAVDAIASMLRMCDRLLDPPAGIFLLFSQHENSPSLFQHMP